MVQKVFRRICPYSSPAIISHHYIQGTISYNGIDVSARLIVIDGENNFFLLGKDTAEELGVLRIEINAMNTESIINQYQSDFTQKKLGKLQNMSVDLHIYKYVPATIHKHYRIPCHLRFKVKAEIHRLVEEDTIEEVRGPTEWLSPVVVVSQPHSEDIHICVDMGKPNVATKEYGTSHLHLMNLYLT